MDSIRSSAMRPALVTLLLAAITVASAACSTYDSTSRKLVNAITPYRINIVQGNFVSREAASQLRPGMSREQVKFLLGTPLLTDVFHANRWDYVFSFRRGDTPVVQQRRFTVFFDGDSLARFGGDELPSEYELIAEIDGMKNGSRKAASRPAETAATPQAPTDAASPQAPAGDVSPTAPNTVTAPTAPSASTGEAPAQGAVDATSASVPAANPTR
ncbi:outer membrane protein assembly factor BamE [Cupriavidus respiraculi]|nr:outer membrane protein assembly factor BamE [Cupriavidus respiraculi]MBY4949325.1 outer membrane protein assembly factor BamE [Cupriavidus respiraculi]